ncbi:MAG TPA: ISNCY family transposase [Bacillota bacterium]|nr:ISNCY family transposase [Bacillota bacterium]
MSKKESRRVYIMERVVNGQLTVRQGAGLLGLSERQVKRLKGRVTKEGMAALAHGNRGRKPAHAVPVVVQEQVVSLINDPLKGATCQHVSELLAERYGLELSARSVRRILARAGLRNRHARKSPRRRRSRDRMPQEGLLVQWDASPYAWLEERGPSCSLHGAIDDATSKILGLYFRPEEDLVGHLMVLKQMTEQHGIPRRLYSDRHTIFFSPKMDKLSIEEELAGRKVALTQFGRAIEELGIAHIPSRSPQARGRVERLWDTLQNRLVIEMRLARVSTLEEANAFLPAYVAKHNRRFAVAAAQPELAFATAPEELEWIVCPRHSRKASNGSTISYEGATYQLVTQTGNVASLRAGGEVAVLCHLDGSLAARYEGKYYRLREFVAPKPEPRRSSPHTRKPRATTKPPANHPWKRPLRGGRRKHDPVDRYFDEHWERHWQSVLEV